MEPSKRIPDQKNDQVANLFGVYLVATSSSMQKPIEGVYSLAKTSQDSSNTIKMLLVGKKNRGKRKNFPLRFRLDQVEQVDEQRNEHDGKRAQQLNQHVQARSSGVFERVAHGVADDCSLVCGAVFAA